MISGIYEIINLVNGKSYIGSAINLNKRFVQHFSNLKNNRHSNRYLQSAWNKYERQFEFRIIEIVEDKTKLLEREQFWIDTRQTYNRNIGYNLRPKASSNLGRITSEETKIKLRKLDMWPHKGGYNCKCEECSEKKKIMNDNWRYARKMKAAFHEDVTEIEHHEDIVVIKMPSEQFEIIRKVLGL